MKRIATLIASLLIAVSAQAGPYLGDYNVGDTVCGYFNTYQPSTGASFTLASGTVEAYKDASATQDTSGITLDNDFDSVTGYHQVCVDTSADGTFFSAGSRFSFVLSAGTVDSVSVVGTEVFSFSLLDGTLATIDTNVDDVETDTGTTLPATLASLATAAALAVTDGVADNILSYIQTNLGLLGANATEAGGDGDHLTEAGGTGDQLSAQPWNADWDAEVQSEATDALNAYDPPTNTEMTTAIDALPTAAENAAQMLSDQRVLTGTCDSGSTTTCVDDALTQAAESQLDDRLICFSDSWCALITGFTPASDTVTTTKTAPATRASLSYTIFPATAN